MTPASVAIQIAPEAKPAILSWMGEVAAFARVLTHTGTLQTIQAQVRFAYARFGHYDLVDAEEPTIGMVSGLNFNTLVRYQKYPSPHTHVFPAHGRGTA